jgi:hypothetical protein
MPKKPAGTKNSKIKVVWIVCDMDGTPLLNEDTGIVREFSSHGAALKVAKEHVNTSQDDEAWVFKLSHVVSRPTGEPIIDVVH